MAGNRSVQEARGKRRGDESPEIIIVSAAAPDAQDRLRRAYELILRAAERAEQKRCTEVTGIREGVADD